MRKGFIVLGALVVSLFVFGKEALAQGGVGFCLATTTAPGVKGIVYVDSNGNGKKDANESLFQGTATAALTKGGTTYGSAATATGTNAGYFCIVNMAAGTYSLTLNPIPNYKITTTNPVSITYSGTQQVPVYFGVAPEPTVTPTPTPECSLNGKAFRDFNENGIADGQDLTYYGVGGATAVLSGAKTGTNVSLISGDFGFEHLPMGQTYIVRLTPPPGYRLSEGTQNPQTFTFDTYHNQNGNACDPIVYFGLVLETPACNTFCSRDADCTGASNGCTECNLSTHTCQVTATASAAFTPAASSSAHPTVSCNLKGKGDANCDGVVDYGDYKLWLEDFYAFKNPAHPPLTVSADFNSDGRVDLVDFNIWRTRFNTQNPTVVPQSPTQSVQLTPTITSAATPTSGCKTVELCPPCVNNPPYCDVACKISLVCNGASPTPPPGSGSATSCNQCGANQSFCYDSANPSASGACINTYSGIYLGETWKCQSCSNQGTVCSQVITWGKSSPSGSCTQFSTPCDVPTGWTKYYNNNDCLNNKNGF